MNSSLGFWFDALRGPFDVYEAPRIEFLRGRNDSVPVEIKIHGEKIFLESQSLKNLEIQTMTVWGWGSLSSDSSQGLPLFGTYRVRAKDLPGDLVFRGVKRKVGWQISVLKSEKLRRDLVWSFFCLILFSGLLVLGLSQNFLSSESQRLEESKLSEPENIAVADEPLTEISKETAGIIVSLAEQAFRGRRSYDESATVTDKVSADLTQIQGLASQISGLSQRIGSGSGVKIQEGSSAKGTQKGAEALSRATQELKGQLNQIKSGRVRSSQINVDLKGTGRSFSSEDELKIRKLFDSQNSRMTKAFDKALKVDGTLSVTVVWQATVQKDGRLGNINFKSTGAYTDAGIKALEQGLREILSGLRVDPKAEGILLKGERFFAQ